MLNRLFDIKFSILIILLFCLPANSVAVPAMGMGYAPKYPASYKHFDYVNPVAPKQGNLTMMGLGTFDSLNPYLLKMRAELLPAFEQK